MNWSDIIGFVSTLSVRDYAVLCINLLLIATARPLMQRITPANSENALRLRIVIMRGINLGIIVIYGYYWLVSHNINNSFAAKSLSILVIVYFAYLINFVLQFIIYRAYGKQRTIAEKITYIETYRTRALNILTSLIVSIIALIACIQQMGFTDLLQAGGVIGILGVMIGLTQGSWAPDIISGLILLNSHIFEEGDVIELDNNFVGIIYKIKMFHTEVLNLSNNHRIMIRNAKMRDITLHNLSKFASAKGLRECLAFNIGYEVKPDAIEKLFEEVTETAIKSSINFEHKFGTEVKLLSAGDHALKWGYIYYVKQVNDIITLRRDLRLTVLKSANAHGISLATPLTHAANISTQTHSANAVLEPGVERG